MEPPLRLAATRPGRGRVHRWVLLIGFWTLLGILSGIQVAYFSWIYGKEMPTTDIFVWQMMDWYFWVPATPLILWLGRVFAFERGAWVKSAALHLAVSIALSVAHLANSTLMGRLFDAPGYHARSFFDLLRTLMIKYIHLDIITYWAILAAGLAFAYYSRFRRSQVVAAELEGKLARAELEALKMQLHPHFLFNTLHAIGVLVRKGETAQAVRMLTGVSDLLRTTLDNAGRQQVTLRQEIEFLDRYLGIEQIRFQDRLTVRTEIEPEVADAIVPNLILQPLAENAIRHGIAPRAAGGTVEILGRRDGDRLILEVRDDGVGLSGGEATGGVGVSNVRARLEQLYPDDHEFSVADRDGGGVSARVAIPLHIAAGSQIRDA